MIKITIASGKGGVGKTMLASSLAVLLAKEIRIVLADCDVDAPNLGLSLGMGDSEYDSWMEIGTKEKAELIEGACIGCRKCLDVCAFGAIGFDDTSKRPIFSGLRCEGCGACLLSCPHNAILLRKAKNARIGTGKTEYGFPIVSGQMKMGESGSGNVVFLVKKKAAEAGEMARSSIMLVDAAAGIGCPVIASVQGSDYVILVTEPTPTALNDLRRVFSVVKHFGIKSGLVINKFDIDPGFCKKTMEFAKSNKIQLLGKIPYDRKFVESLVNLKPVVVYDGGFSHIFKGIIDRVGISKGGKLYKSL